MDTLIVLANSVILSLLYQKQLEQSEDLAVLKSRMAAIEALAVERRKRGKEDAAILLRDDTIGRPH